MTPEQLAIAGLFSALTSFAGVVIRLLWARIQALEVKLDESNEASRDLIRIQAQMLEGQGVQIVPTSERR